MDKDKLQETNKIKAFVEFFSSLIFFLALGVPIIFGIFIAIQGYIRAWEKGDWLNIFILVVGILLLCIFELPSWLAMRKAKKQKDITNNQSE